MSEDTAVAEVSADTKELGDKLADLTLKQAKELSDYLKDAHGIEPAAGGGAVMVTGALVVFVVAVALAVVVMIPIGQRRKDKKSIGISLSMLKNIS